MNSKYFTSAILIFLVGITTYSNINAQSQAERWTKVTSISPGTRLVVEADGRKPVKGKMARATAQSITIKSAGKEVDIPQTDVSAVYLGKRPSTVKRGLIGALAGAGAGFLIGGIAAASGATHPLAAAAGFLYGIPAGAVIGVATSGGTKKGSLIYAR